MAVERAAQDLRSVTVIRIDLLFSPGGYSDTIRYQGRDVRVREPDGVHLNVAGTAIAAKAVAQVIRTSARTSDAVRGSRARTPSIGFAVIRRRVASRP